jgi:hypothetical protein
MGEARRRKLAAAGFVDRPDAIKRFADAVLRGTQQALMVTVGPVVGDLTAGHDVRHWNSMVGSCDADGAFRIHAERRPALADIGFGLRHSRGI